MSVPSAHSSRRIRPFSLIEPSLAAFIDGSPDALLVVDPRTMKVLHANTNACRYLGYPRRSVENFPLETFIGDESPSTPGSLKERIAGLARAGTAEAMSFKVSGGTALRGKVLAQRFVQKRRPWYLLYLREAGRGAELDHSLEKYRAIFENANDALFLLRNRMIVDCNKKAYELFGYIGKEEMTGKSPFDFPLKEGPDEKTLKRNMEQIIAQALQGASQFFAWEHTLPDGSTMNFEVNARRIMIDGELFLLAAVRDRSDQMTMEKKLKESAERFRTIIEEAPFGAHLYTLYPDGRLVFTGANRAADRILGLENRQFIGKTIEKAFPALVDTDIPAAYRRVASGGSIFEKEQISYSEQNISGAFEVHAFNTGPNQVAVFFTDITERKRNEMELRRREEEYRRLVETANEGIWVFDEHYDTVFANQKMAEMLGYTQDEMKGKPLTDFIAPEDKEENWKRMEERRHGKKGIYERKLIRKDGSSSWMAVSATPLFDKHRHFQGSFAMLNDITARKKAEYDLRESFARLQKTTDGIIVSISHLVETRDPYTAGHQRHVAQLAYAIAREMGLPEDRANGIRVAGQIHDLGKIYVPAEILSKPGPLSMIEFEMIKVHPQAGYEILRPIDFDWPVAEVTHQHQERLDGSGYPRGLKGEEILLETRIVSVADTVEAMSFRRPYRSMIGLDKALAEVEKHKGTQFDPRVVDACLDLFRSGKFSFET